MNMLKFGNHSKSKEFNFIVLHCTKVTISYGILLDHYSKKYCDQH